MITPFLLVARKVLQRRLSTRLQGAALSGAHAVSKDAALTSRSNPPKTGVFPKFTELGAGEIGGLTLAPGLYKWGTGVAITADVTLLGGPDDIWIFKVAGTLKQANATRVTLAGGALPTNVFWQIAGAVIIGMTAQFEGVVL